MPFMFVCFLWDFPVPCFTMEAEVNPNQSTKFIFGITSPHPDAFYKCNVKITSPHSYFTCPQWLLPAFVRWMGVESCYIMIQYNMSLHISGLVQNRRNSSVLPMELHLSCTNPSNYVIATTNLTLGTHKRHPITYPRCCLGGCPSISSHCTFPPDFMIRYPSISTHYSIFKWVDLR